MEGHHDHPRVPLPFGQQDDTRRDATAKIIRSGYADILAVLGLDDVPAPDLDTCPYCTTRLTALCVWHGKNATAPAPRENAGPLIIDGRQCCHRCRNPLPDPIANGGRKPCRRAACRAAAAEEP